MSTMIIENHILRLQMGQNVDMIECIVCGQTVNDMRYGGEPDCPGCTLEEHKLYRLIGRDCPCYTREEE